MSPRYDMNFTQEQRLLYYLLKNYEKAVRPVRNASHAIVVKLGLTLTNIFDMVGFAFALARPARGKTPNKHS